MSDRIWRHSQREKGMWRGWLTYNVGEDVRRQVKASMEVIWRRQAYYSNGIKLHLGNKGSETPIDAHILLFGNGVFLQLDFPGAGALCEWLGRGHKRNLSLKVHGGALWWELWYDDDGGYDAWHECDSWRRPKLYPWRWGRKKYRGWMCLRQGNIDLNPLTAFWGNRYFNYEDLEKRTALVPIGQFENDEYNVGFTLQKQTRARRNGPKWARHVSNEGYVADWQHNPGIPVRNHNWKGDTVLRSAVRITDVDNWLAEAVSVLTKDIKQQRQRYNYRPPVTEEK